MRHIRNTAHQSYKTQGTRSEPKKLKFKIHLLRIMDTHVVNCKLQHLKPTLSVSIPSFTTQWGRTQNEVTQSVAGFTDQGGHTRGA